MLCRVRIAGISASELVRKDLRVVLSGVGRAAVFLDDEDRLDFQAIVGKLVEVGGFDFPASCMIFEQVLFIECLREACA